MSTTQINQLPLGTANVEAVVAADNANLTTTEKIKLGDIAKLATKNDVGLGNVDNTSDVNKPVSTAQQNALATKAPIADPTFTGTVGGITKSMVGLGNVDNTSDVNKPVSTAQQTALDLKSNVGHTHTLAELNSWLSQPGSKNIYVDNGRTDTYTEDGSQYRPYKTIRAAFAAVGNAADATEFVNTTHRFYCFRIAPGVYDEASGGNLQVPRRLRVCLDFSGGATIIGNLVRDLSSITLSSSTGDENATLVLIGGSGRPMYETNNTFAHVGIIGNITIITNAGIGHPALHLMGCGARVIEFSGARPAHFYADHNSTWDTLKRLDNGVLTVYLSQSSNSSSVGSGGNMIGSIFIANVNDFVWMSDKSIFTTSSAYLRLGANVNLPSYFERRISSFTRSNNVATVTLSENHGFSLKTANGYTAEQYILINGVTENTSFNTSTWGAKVVAYPSATTIQYESTGPDVSTPVSVTSGKLIRGTFLGNVASNSFVTLDSSGRGEIDAAHTLPVIANESELGAGSSMIRGIANAIFYSNPLTSWSASTTQFKNTLFIHSNGYQYRVTSPIGRTGTTQPTWPTTIGATVSDGTITWVTEELGFMPGEVQAYNVQSKLEKLSNARNIYYRNSSSGLASTNVKAAVDELKTLVDGKATIVSVPASASSPGTPGQIAYNTSYLYVCVATNTWLRTSLVTW